MMATEASAPLTLPKRGVDMSNLGHRIKEYRKKNDLTQEKLADYLGVTYQSISKWEMMMPMPQLMGSLRR